MKNLLRTLAICTLTVTGATSSVVSCVKIEKRFDLQKFSGELMGMAIKSSHSIGSCYNLVSDVKKQIKFQLGITDNDLNKTGIIISESDTNNGDKSVVSDSDAIDKSKFYFVTMTASANSLILVDGSTIQSKDLTVGNKKFDLANLKNHFTGTAGIDLTTENNTANLNICSKIADMTGLKHNIYASENFADFWVNPPFNFSSDIKPITKDPLESENYLVAKQDSIFFTGKSKLKVLYNYDINNIHKNFNYDVAVGSGGNLTDDEVKAIKSHLLEDVVNEMQKKVDSLSEKPRTIITTKHDIEYSEAASDPISTSTNLTIGDNELYAIYSLTKTGLDNRLVITGDVDYISISINVVRNT